MKNSILSCLLVIGIATMATRCFAEGKSKPTSATAKQADSQAGKKPFSANWQSLQQYQCPEWFRDAKFGIYAHWGPYSVPEYPGNTDWYSHHMYLSYHPIHAFHLQKYGPLDKFGYKDLIPKFTGENFDADAWAKLYLEAGAKFAGPVAEHSDGFSMWATELTPWNAGKMGPKRDVVGELEQAIRKTDMKFVTSFHHAWKWAWYPTGPTQPGQPETDANDPQYELLYGPPAPKEAWKKADAHVPAETIPKNMLPPEIFAERWLAKINEVVDRYEPDLLWFDNRMNLIPESYRQQMAAHFYNRAAEADQEVVLTYKFDDMVHGTGVLDLERSRMPDIHPEPWLCDMSIASNSWAYSIALEYYSTDRLIHDLVDIVSKNGCLLLNIAPRKDGTIPEEQQQRLRGIGAWLAVNGEAIYGTRPWAVYGEGPAKTPEGHLADLKFKGFTQEDIRFTKKGDTVYAIVLGCPGEGEIIEIQSMSKTKLADFNIQSIEMLGSSEPTNWQQDESRLSLQMTAPPQHTEAVVWRIKLAKH